MFPVHRRGVRDMSAYSYQKGVSLVEAVMAARTKLLLEGPVLPPLPRLSAPNVLNLLAIAGMITFDGLLVGRLGRDALAGVSLAFPFVMLIQHTAASGMGGGVSCAIARALGAGKRDVANSLVLHTFVLALGLAAAFSTVLLLGAPHIFRWMGGDGEILSLGLTYANVVFGGEVSICMLNLPGSAVRGRGNMGLRAGVIVRSVTLRRGPASLRSTESQRSCVELKDLASVSTNVR
jgi:Na+-driven multidrug efflux pump